MQQKLS